MAEDEGQFQVVEKRKGRKRKLDEADVEMTSVETEETTENASKRVSFKPLANHAALTQVSC